MDQSRALNALEPYLALAKSATSPRAASDLIAQATSNPNTYVFAELLNQPNIQSLAGNDQYAGSLELLKIFAWGTWEQYTSSKGLPEVSKVQSQKLRLLSLLTIASTPATKDSNLTYTSLCKQLGLSSDFELEQLVTQAIYANLIDAKLNPASQTVTVASVSPLRDLSPGSASAMIVELEAFSGRCDSVLSSLEAELESVKSNAQKRAVREAKTEKQVEALTEPTNKRQTRDDGDAMDVDGSGLGSGSGKKRSGR